MLRSPRQLDQSDREGVGIAGTILEARASRVHQRRRLAMVRDEWTEPCCHGFEDAAPKGLRGERRVQIDLASSANSVEVRGQLVKNHAWGDRRRQRHGVGMFSIGSCETDLEWRKALLKGGATIGFEGKREAFPTHQRGAPKPMVGVGAARRGPCVLP